MKLLRTPFQGGKAGWVGLPWAQSETITQSHQLLTNRIHWHTIIRYGEAQFPLTCSILDVFQQQSCQENKDSSLSAYGELLSQQDLFILCSRPVFTPHALCRAAVTKVTAPPHWLHRGTNSGMKATGKLEIALSPSLDHGSWNFCNQNCTPYLSNTAQKRSIQIKEKRWLKNNHRGKTYKIYHFGATSTFRI